MRLPRGRGVAPAPQKGAEDAVSTVPVPMIGGDAPTTSLLRMAPGERANRRRPTRPMREVVPPSSDLSQHRWIRRHAGPTHPSRPNGGYDPEPARQPLL